MSEGSVDKLWIELERGVQAHGDPFRSVLARAEARPKYEQIIKKYLDLLTSQQDSTLTKLKVLQAMDEIRAPDISRQGFRTSRIGEMDRRRWPGRMVKPNLYGLEPISSRSRNRALRSAPLSQSPIVNWFRDQDNEECRWELTDDRIVDFSKTLLLHMGFVGSDLIIALDENLSLHCYGKSATVTQKVQPEAFSEYGYAPGQLNPRGVIWGPIVCKGARERLVALATQLHSRFDGSPDAQFDRKFEQEFAEELDSLFAIEELLDCLKSCAAKRNCTLEELCLVFLPDEALFLLPLSLLGSSRGGSLASRLGGTSTAFSLVAFKKSLADYHWGSIPNRRGDSPTCVMFATNNPHAGWLDLRPEVEYLKRAFGERRFLTVPSSTRNEFYHWYSAGDICWFAGHGFFAIDKGMDLDGKILPIPETGPLFADGPITNLELITTSLWNFKPLWLTVFNSCVLGRHVMVGPNPLGFMSALVTVGATAAIGALWPVENQAAINFADCLSAELNKVFNDHDFPRARALSRAIRRMLSEGRAREWEIAPYVLFGLP